MRYVDFIAQGIKDYYADQEEQCWFCEDKEELFDDYTGFRVKYIESETTMPSIEFDNLGNEYPHGVVRISYCPFCGRKVRK